MGKNYLFMNDILWAYENDFRSSRPFLGASRMALYTRSGKGVQLPFKTTPDSPRVISPEWAARGDKYYVTTLRPRVRNFNRTLSFDGVGKATAFCYNDH